jgi:hypothetical protein
VPADLETVDLDGVSILDADVEIHAIGSPPEGDVFTPEDIAGMALAANELEAAGEWRVPNRITGEIRGRGKLGHTSQQALLAASELPAAGWLTNQRVSEDGKRLLADIKKVPATVAQLIRAGAYRTRSAELSRVKSQTTGKNYPWVVTGIAWLGGKMPSVRTLDDVVKMYQADDAEQRLLVYEPVEAGSVEELRDAVAALSADFQRRADTRPMPDTKYTDEQRRKFAEATGLEQDKVTDEILKAAGVGEDEATQLKLEADQKTELATVKLELAEAKRQLAGAQTAETELETAKRELAQVKKELESKDTPYSTEDVRKLEQRAEAGERAEKRLYEMERDAYLKEAIVGGKFRPGQLKELQAMYDAGPDAARLFIQNSPTHDEFVAEFGSDSDRFAVDDATREAFEGELASMIGVKPGELL